MHRSLFAVIAFAAAVFTLQTSGVLAQQPSPAGGQGQPQSKAPAATQGQPQGSKAPRTAGAKDEAGAAPSQDAALRQRIEKLEEQLLDLQVVIGTLESLARTPAVANPPAPAFADQGGNGGGGDTARIDGIETQIRALTAQVEQLAAEVRSGGGQRRSDASQAGPFGSTTVTSGNGDAIGDLLTDNGQTRQGGPASTQGGGATVQSQPGDQASLDAGGGAQATFADDPQQVYQTAYGYILQKNYSAAQSGLGDFLRRFPNHQLVPNALYWLGETYYVQQNYADAAEAFDLVVTAHGRSIKAPDSLLKRAMSLAQLGKGKEACSALKDLAARYPTPPQHVRTGADAERQRIQCS